MKIVTVLATPLALLIALPASAERPDGAALCRILATDIKGEKSLSSHPGIRPIEALSTGPLAPVTLATESDAANASDTGEDVYLAAFKSKFAPDRNLAGAVAEVSQDMSVAVESLPDNAVHAFTAQGGSAPCVTFIFFKSSDHRSSLLPDPPSEMDGDMSPDIGLHRTECYVSRGYLAAIGKRTAFVVADYDPTGFAEDLRVTTLNGDSWSKSCLVSLQFATIYRANVGPHGMVNVADVGKLAIEVARALDEAELNKTPFSFGPPVSNSDLQHIADLQHSFRIAPGSHAVYFHDKLLVVEAIHPSFGWRDAPGYHMTISEPDHSDFRLFAVVDVGASRGRLLSTQVRSLPLGH